MSIKTKGLKQLEKQLKKMKNSVKELEGRNEVPFNDLFTPNFMKAYTSFVTFDELLHAGGFKAETTEEFTAIPEDLFDAHIASVTKFRTWNNMLEKATSDYIAKKFIF